jgi:hypothetical protein
MIPTSTRNRPWRSSARPVRRASSTPNSLLRHLSEQTARCHCSGCRAATGSAFRAFAGIEREKLTITEGLEDIAVFGEEDLNDTRCGACGSFLFSVVRNGAFVHVAMGSLVDAPTIRPTEHIFVGSKAAWFEITDNLPQFDEYAT